MKQIIFWALLSLAVAFSACAIFCTWNKPRIELIDSHTQCVGIEDCEFYHGPKDCMMIVDLGGRFATIYCSNAEANIIKDKARSVVVRYDGRGGPIEQYKLIGWE